MDLGEQIETDETGCITGVDTGRVVAKFSHVGESVAFVELYNNQTDLSVEYEGLKLTHHQAQRLHNYRMSEIAENAALGHPSFDIEE